MPRPDRLNFRRAVQTDESLDRMIAAGVWDGDRASLPAVYLSDLYQVLVFRTDAEAQMGGASLGDGVVFPRCIHLSIRRIDRQPIRDWRDLQRIKDEIVGVRHEAIEIFPAADRLVDAANQYHLFVFADPSVRLPIGFNYRSVIPGQTALTFNNPAIQAIIEGSHQADDDVDAGEPSAREIIEQIVDADDYDAIEAVKDVARRWLGLPDAGPSMSTPAVPIGTCPSCGIPNYTREGFCGACNPQLL